MLGLVEHSSKDSHHSVTKATERNTQKAFYEKLASLIDKYTQNHIMYYFFCIYLQAKGHEETSSAVHNSPEKFENNVVTLMFFVC